jgi:DNA end-binding protein Ku
MPRPPSKPREARPRTNWRATWQGAITFGMINIPVQLFNTKEAKADISFNQLHKDCKSRLKQKRWCPVDDGEVFQDEIQRGFEVAPGQFVIIEDDELKALAVPSLRTLELTSFVEVGSVDPVLVEQSYWLEPDPIGAKAYALLVKTMRAKNVSAVATLTMRGHERICALRVVDDVLVLETLYYPHEVRAVGSAGLLDQTTEVSEAELQMAGMLVDAFHGEFNPADYHDTYHDAVVEMIERKKAGLPVATQVAAEALPEPSGDLMAALAATIAAKKAAEAKAA